MAAKRHHHSSYHGHHGRAGTGHQQVGSDPMYTERMQDDGMIKEDSRAIANLPQEVMIKPYEMTGPYMPEDLDDTIRGVDRQMDMDDSDRRKTFKPRKV